MANSNLQSTDQTKPRLQTMDITSLKAVLADLRKKIVPGRFEKVQQLDNSTLQIAFRVLEGLVWIELSWNSESARIVEIKAPKKIEGESTLSKQIRYGLRGMALIELKQEGFDRIVELGFSFRPNEVIKKQLILEIMGRHSNILFLDEKRQVITLGKQIRNNKSRLRPISTGDPYISPPSLQGVKPKKDEVLEKWRNSLSILPVTLKQALKTTFQGISPAFILQLASEEKDAANRLVNLPVQQLSETEWEKLFFRWNIWLKALEKENFFLAFSGPTPYRVWGANPSSNQDNKESISLRLGNYYKSYLAEKHLTFAFIALCKELEKKRDNEEKELKKQELLYSKISEINSMKEIADTILSSEKPSKEDIKKAQKLYTQVKKLRRSKRILVERIELHKGRINFINETDLFLNYIINNQNDLDSDKLESIRELQQDLEGFILGKKQTRSNKQSSKHKSENILRLNSPNGLEIQIGRNHQQNESISIKNAKKGDIWFHVQECPGSHIVIKAAHGKVEDLDIEVAANLAAFFSKAKHNNKVSVLMVPTNKLQKLKGAAPGMVTPKEIKVLWGRPSDGQHYLEKSTKDA